MENLNSNGGSMSSLPRKGRHAITTARFRFRHSRPVESFMGRLSGLRHNSSGDESQLDDGDTNMMDRGGFAPHPAQSVNSTTPTGDSAEPLEPSESLSLTSPRSSSTSSASPSQPPKMSELLLLPQELFDQITSYLSPAHIVVLALVNKELFGRFLYAQIVSGSQAANASPNGPPAVLVHFPSTHFPPWRLLGSYIRRLDTNKSKARGTLLSLLDNDLLDVVYCYKCKRMHDPFLTFVDRAYAPHKSHRCTPYGEDYHMPARATRKLLRTITKRRQRGAAYKDLMQQVNNTVTTYKNGIMVQVSLRIRYRGDSLFLRQQQVVSSIDKSALTLWLFGQQLKDSVAVGTTSTTNPKVFKICNHASWFDQYCILMDEMYAPLCKKDHHGGGLAPCHTASCFSRSGLDASRAEAHPVGKRWQELANNTNKPSPAPLLSPHRFGEVFGCPQCTTDFNLDVVKLPAPFYWGFVLTTWLDLGPVDFCPKWDSHRQARPGRQYSRSPPYGEICASFENLAKGTPFRPSINELDLERMKNYGWAQDAAAGKNRYISWTSGHSPDPSTGKFPDPDPLVDEDFEMCDRA